MDSLHANRRTLLGYGWGVVSAQTQYAVDGVMTRFWRSDVEAKTIIEKFNVIENLIQDLVEIEQATRNPPPKGKSDTI
jgi:hypothetical protein